MAKAKVVLNQKLFRKLKVEITVWGNSPNAGCASMITIRFPETGPFSKLTEKQVEPLRKEIERYLCEELIEVWRVGHQVKI